MKTMARSVLLIAWAIALGAMTLPSVADASSLAAESRQAVPHHHVSQHHAPPAAADDPPAHEADEEHALHKINWLDFGVKDQPPFVSLVINFAILLGIYFTFGRKPIAAALANRRARIATAIEEADRIKREAEERSRLYQSKLEKLEGELATARQLLVDTGKSERARIIREAEETAARIRKDTERMIEQEIEQMREDLTREIVDIATRMAGELLVSHVNAADHTRIGQNYLDDLRAPHRLSTPRKEAS